MNLDVPAPSEVPVEQTRKTSPLTDIEKFRIIELRKASISWHFIGRAIGRPHSTYQSFFEKWEKHQKFALTMGRLRKVTKEDKELIIGRTLENRRTSIRAVARETSFSYETIRMIRHENKIHYYDSVPVLPLGAAVKATGGGTMSATTHSHRPASCGIHRQINDKSGPQQWRNMEKKR
jgi:hypothetical protein